MKNFRAPPPFAVFFPLAALDAILCGGAWLATLQKGTIAAISEWHRSEYLAGFVAAAMAGFFLTALPRWTGRPLAKGSFASVLACWIGARLASAFWPFALGVPAIALALVAAFHIWRARDARNIKTVALLMAYASAGFVLSSPFPPHMRALAAYAAIAAIAGLIVLIGGRVLPALTARFDDLCGEPASVARGKAIERPAAVLTAIGLVCWLIAPEGVLSASLFLAAGASQFLRMASWFGRRTLVSPPLLAFYAAYSSIPIGFILLALHAWAPAAAPRSAALHVWTIGGFGGMILTVMSSMIRKRCGLAFAPSLAAESAAVLCLAAATARACADFATEPLPFLTAAAIAWSAAFALFLAAFRAPLWTALVRTRQEAPRRSRRTENHS